MQIADIVKHDTGEIIGMIEEGDRIIKGKSMKVFQQMKDETEEWIIENFYKGNVDELELWINDLSITEKAFLFSIVPYISYDDCHLEYKNHTDISTEDLPKITGMSRNTVYDVIKTLIDKDILYKGENSKNRQFFINPWLFCRGQRINKVLKAMFKNYKIRVYGGKKWDKLKQDK